MALKPIDQVFNRWLLDGNFRALMNENPEEALAGYDLSDTDRKKLSRLSRKERRQAKAQKVTVSPQPRQPVRIAAAYNRFSVIRNPFSRN